MDTCFVPNPGRNRGRVLRDVFVLVQGNAALVARVLRTARVLGRLGAALPDLGETKLSVRHGDGAEEVAPHEVVAEKDSVVAFGISRAEREPTPK